jgi:hypothetical protein
MDSVFVVMSGDGCDGNDLEMVGVYSTLAFAKAVRNGYSDGYRYNISIDEWTLDSLTPPRSIVEWGEK